MHETVLILVRNNLVIRGAGKSIIGGGGADIHILMFCIIYFP